MSKTPHSEDQNLHILEIPESQHLLEDLRASYPLGIMSHTALAAAICIEQLQTDRAELIEALRNAVEIIRTWHNMGGCEDVWDIYYENAPEMKQIRALLARLESK